MKIRRLVYRFMSDEFLERRVDILHKKIELTKDSKTRLKIVDENNDILVAMIYKHYDDTEFIKMVKEGLEELLKKSKGV